MLDPDMIQVAGVRDAAEARMLEACGVRYIGFPLRLAVHAEDMDDRSARAVIAGLAPTTRPVLITYLDTASDVMALSRFLDVGIVQLHGDIEAAELGVLRRRAGDLTVIKSLVVGRGPAEALEEAVVELTPLVDAFITDTFNPGTGASGATGRTHDWEVSARLVAASARPVILAGGLTPANVAGAIERVKPAGVDVHTGVEDRTGQKEKTRVAAFVREAGAGFARLHKRSASS